MQEVNQQPGEGDGGFRPKNWPMSAWKSSLPPAVIAAKELLVLRSNGDPPDLLVLYSAAYKYSAPFELGAFLSIHFLETLRTAPKPHSQYMLR